MRKVSALGRTLVTALAFLFVVEGALFVGSKLLARRYNIVAPPDQIEEWTASSAEPPTSDYQRGTPKQISVQYTNSNQAPVHVDYAMVQNVDQLRPPVRYLVDSDGRTNPLQTAALKSPAGGDYTLSIVQGIDLSIICFHWYQRPGGMPTAVWTSRGGDIIKAFAIQKPLYECDIWVEKHPTTDLVATRELLQKFADSLSDQIKAAG